VTDAPPGGAYAEYIAPPPPTPAASPGPTKRRPPWRAAFFALAGVAIIAGVAWALLGDRVLVVRSVAVTGTHLVTPAQVLAAADVPLGTPLMRVNPGAVTRRIEAIRQVASATVSEDWPDHLRIAVTERVPVLAVRMAGGGYDLLDPSGVIVRFTTTRPGLPLFVTTLPGSALGGDPGVAAAAAVLTELTPALARTVTTVSVARMQVTLAMNGGRTVVWGNPGNGAAKDREIRILLRGAVNYLDVSAPGTAVTR
jgi:cell division protein FtsQ